MCKQLLLILFFLPLTLIAQEKFTITGVVTNQEDGETVIGARVSIKSESGGAVSNPYGIYSITASKGEVTLIANATNLEIYSKTIQLERDTTINIELRKPATQFEELVINAKQGENVKNVNMGQIELKIEDIKKMPAFLGEVDLIKAIQMLPGVSSVSEGGQGFYVRGGGPDQNLVLLDDAMVYNASHLFGFFSVFNPDAVKNVNLIKGGMPASYGGRLSSVLEVNMMEGNNKKFGVSGGLGLISSRLAIEAPLKKDKGSFMLSARRTYMDMLMKAFIPKTSSFSGSGYYFYDLNLKANYKLSEKDHIYLSAYFGKDEFYFKNKVDQFGMEMPWQNGVASLKWTHLFGRKLFMSMSANYTNYSFSFNAEQDAIKLKLATGINDIGGKVDFSYFPKGNRHTIKFGAQYTHHQFLPSSVSAEQQSTVFDTGDAQKLYSHETGVYILDEWDITEKLKINAGVRYVTFTHAGPFTRYIKGNGLVGDSSVYYNKGEKIAFYQGLEPRFSARYLLPDNSSIKAGFAYNNQFIHLASISSVSLPTDIWLPSTEKTRPQKGWQAALGYFRNFAKDMFETSVEIYYKGMNNLVEFKEGALPTDNVGDNTDNLLTFGKGWSYGAELFIKKTRGKFTGWLGYTWSKTDRKFPELNEGRIFPAKYDRRHDLSIVASYQINKRVTLGSAFVFATGNTLTMPMSWYLHNQNLLFQYGDRNSTRMKPYHRLDFSVTIYDKEFKVKRDRATGEELLVKKKYSSNWVVSIYNVYSRANPYFMYLKGSGEFSNGDFTVSAKQVSLFPIIPSVTWNFKL